MHEPRGSTSFQLAGRSHPSAAPAWSTPSMRLLPPPPGRSRIPHYTTYTWLCTAPVESVLRRSQHVLTLLRHHSD